MRMVPTYRIAVAVTVFVAAQAWVDSHRVMAAAARDGLARVELAASNHVQILTELKATMPRPAWGGIERALASAYKGQDAARSAFPEEDRANADTSGWDKHLWRTRERLADSFEQSVVTLRRMIDKVPVTGAARLRTAMARIEEQRAVALDNFDRAVAERSQPPAGNAAG